MFDPDLHCECSSSRGLLGLKMFVVDDDAYCQIFWKDLLIIIIFFTFFFIGTSRTSDCCPFIFIDEPEKK